MAALVVSGRVGREVDDLRCRLGAASLERIPPHITLASPVDVELQELAEAERLLGAAAAASRPLTLGLGPAATFWPGAPVVFLEVTGDPGTLGALAELHELLSAAPLAAPAGAGRRERPFVPHVTLDQRALPASIPAALESLSSYRAVVTLSKVSLLQHEREEKLWRQLAEAPLGPAEP